MILLFNCFLHNSNFAKISGGHKSLCPPRTLKSGDMSSVGITYRNQGRPGPLLLSQAPTCGKFWGLKGPPLEPVVSIC